ncbi:type 1 glutamine amidotransferase [Saliphagus sp. LR7]|uniref:type 1 glutamine amidotransferase n=1 Tax=Saliphagus sp. LR7 TaxID=2282654 RepID=UPI000DF859AE|nr:type 1 glutamine amidotransferase [Saliphagus sp. LR7]
MDPLRIAVLDASHGDANTPRNFRRELEADLDRFDVTAGELPPDFAYDGFLVTGSRSSVYWDEDWIAGVEEWAGEAIERGLPALGVCWGHQLLASVLGGTVEDMGVYEVGYSEIEQTGDSPLFSGIGEHFTAFTSHSDAVTELPPGARPLAANEYSNHGFSCGDVFGIQFHPEYDQETARHLIREKELTDDRRRSLLASVTDENHAATREAKRVFENFLAYVRDVRTDDTRDDEAASAADSTPTAE